MTTLSAFLLTSITTYGAPLLGLVLLLGALGFPIPSSFILVVVGAISRQGLMDGFAAGILGLLGAVIGDSLSFLLGRWGVRFTPTRVSQSIAWTRAQSAFARGGGLAIFVTRFFPASIAIPINLIAAASGYSFRRYLAIDLAGELVWIALYVGLGYFFGSQWDVISQSRSNVGLMVAVVAVAAAEVYLWRTRVKQKTMLVI